MTHFFVQSLSIPMRFTYENKERIPGSVFLFDLKDSADDSRRFDFRDDLVALSVFIRVGNRGIIAAADGGAIDLAIGDAIRSDGARKLHPLQFYELGARIFYKARLFNRTPKYTMMKHKDNFEVMQMPLAGLSGLPVFNDWNHPDYAEVLSAFTGHPIEKIAPGDRSKVMTWLRDQNGKHLNIPLKRPVSA
jgi:hypothetical protein